MEYLRTCREQYYFLALYVLSEYPCDPSDLRLSSGNRQNLFETTYRSACDGNCYLCGSFIVRRTDRRKICRNRSFYFDRHAGLCGRRIETWHAFKKRFYRIAKRGCDLPDMQETAFASGALEKINSVGVQGVFPLVH